MRCSLSQWPRRAQAEMSRLWATGEHAQVQKQVWSRRAMVIQAWQLWGPEYWAPDLTTEGQVTIYGRSLGGTAC